MKYSEIKALSVSELSEKMVVVEGNLQKMKFAHSVSPLENPMQLVDLKKHLARLKTELHANTIAMVTEKAASGELTNFNIRAYLAETKLPTPMNLGKIKKIISQSVK